MIGKTAINILLEKQLNVLAIDCLDIQLLELTVRMLVQQVIVAARGSCLKVYQDDVANRYVSGS